MIKKEIFEKYADLKEQIAGLTAEADVLKPQISTMLIDSGLEEEGLELKDRGVFTVGHRRTYQYPESITFADAALKESKKKAEQTGEATYSETVYPLYKPKKA